MTSFLVRVLQKKFTLLHADFSKIVLKYSNEVHLLRYLTPQGIEVKIWERGANLGPGYKIMLSLAKLKLLPDVQILRGY